MTIESIKVKPLEWVASEGGRWLRARTPVGVYEVRSNERMVEVAKQRAFDRYSQKVKSMLEAAPPSPAPKAMGSEPVDKPPVDNSNSGDGR
jgi:hypothetical protein